MSHNPNILPAQGGLLAETYRQRGLRACLRKIVNAVRMQIPLLLMGGRTNASVGAYFDLITDDARMFYGDSFHFGYFRTGDETLEAALAEQTDLVAEMAQIATAGQVLDIGCGLGAPAIQLARKYPCRITGINISPEQVRQGRTLIGEAGLADRITLVQGNALHLDFPADSFDALLCIEAAGDICVTEKQKVRLIDEMYRVLRPGGTIGFSDLVFKGRPGREEERAMRMILYHEGRELVTDWPDLFEKRGFLIAERREILPQTMKTWGANLAVYERRAAEVDRRYGKRIARRTREQLRLLPEILRKYGSFPVLSIRKPTSRSVDERCWGSTSQ